MRTKPTIYSYVYIATRTGSRSAHSTGPPATLEKSHLGHSADKTTAALASAQSGTKKATAAFASARSRTEKTTAALASTQSRVKETAANLAVSRRTITTRTPTATNDTTQSTHGSEAETPGKITTSVIEKVICINGQQCETRTSRPRRHDKIIQYDRKGRRLRLPVGREKDQLARQMSCNTARPKDRVPYTFTDEQVAERKSKIQK